MGTQEQIGTMERGEETNEVPVRIATTPPSMSLDMDNRSDLRKAQEQDPDIKPILLWMKHSEVRPDWETVAPYSPATKIHWA